MEELVVKLWISEIRVRAKGLLFRDCFFSRLSEISARKTLSQPGTYWAFLELLPSGKQPHNYGKSPFLMGKSTINGHFP